MTTTLLKTISLGLLTATLLSFPTPARAQNTNPPAIPTKSASDTNAPVKHLKKPGAGPFHGKLASLDKVGKTITVGKRTFHITSETKIKKSGKPATLADGVVGEPVSGYVKTLSGGKLVATTVNFGAKASPEGVKKSEAQKETK